MFYALRHKETNQLMPELRRGSGYSWWNPNGKDQDSIESTGCPRLFKNKLSAERALAQWGRGCLKQKFESPSFDSFEPGDRYMEPIQDGRKKDDLEVIPINIVWSEK